MESFSTIAVAQTKRVSTLPQQLQERTPLRELILEGPRQRNAVLDYIFYDLAVLTAEEAVALAPSYAAEGAILEVAPTSDGGLKVWPSVAEYKADCGVSEPRCVTVAGVGSSALGAAAFARNVANAVGKPVLSVVSGYGLSDLMTEAIGGFFLFGYLNSVRHAFEPLDDVTRPTRSTPPGTSDTIAQTIRKSDDVRSLVALLQEGDIDLLIGHSKGNLVISEALFALNEVNPVRAETLAEHGQIITIGAKIYMPKPWKKVTDVMGSLDGFGWLNSRHSIETDIRVPGKWHHTNTELPFSLPVTETLRQIV